MGHTFSSTANHTLSALYSAESPEEKVTLVAKDNLQLGHTTLGNMGFHFTEILVHVAHDNILEFGNKTQKNPP